MSGQAHDDEIAFAVLGDEDRLTGLVAQA